jgi:tRNA(fMet)-specific endonuclease VapC
VIRFMLDTNICIDVLRRNDRKILGHFNRYQVGEIAMSSIVLAELQHGIFKGNRQSEDREVMIDFCSPLEILPFDELAAGTYGRVRSSLEQAGTPIGPFDTLIAAHALSLDCTLVTNNEREFRRVDGLLVENWTI